MNSHTVPRQTPVASTSTSPGRSAGQSAFKRWGRGEGSAPPTSVWPPGPQHSDDPRLEPAPCPWPARSGCACSGLEMLGYDQPQASHDHGVTPRCPRFTRRRPSGQQSANSPHLTSKQPPTTQDVESESRYKSREFEIHRSMALLIRRSSVRARRGPPSYLQVRALTDHATHHPLVAAAPGMARLKGAPMWSQTVAR